ASLLASGSRSLGSRAHAFERERRVDDHAEAPAAGLFDADWRVALVEPALQQNQAALEIVAEVGQLERWIEPHFFVRELHAPFVDMLVEKYPEHASGNTLNEVLAVEEGTAVDREEPHARRLRRRRLRRERSFRCDCVRAFGALVRGVDLDRAR